jgi:hypothetical protein
VNSHHHFGDIHLRKAFFTKERKQLHETVCSAKRDYAAVATNASVFLVLYGFVELTPVEAVFSRARQEIMHKR